ncbi:uncharacterized protein BO66DRAFT_447523 [Aspergillus aculeatinus CBS 121060]|uniref:Uncharacterized protein n=1 Tax=Aspergillus aculeatinus CBS 121060 TaxID=1448322 RepID=A0ACD1HEK3_9EURO|nr:hypothetical protein BO66DRAFT_447523 [Aspergillus aculeatinus CBS 121060]RAH71864.1 hypothetical protein BO66DRAFT_447523 [Aspergillus aculeatinus CBS 121060]
MASKLAHTLFTLASVGLLASAQLAVDTTPVTAAASVETVSMIDASGLPITTVSDAGDNAWYIPLTGPASAATAAWGANVHMHSEAAALLPITFGTAPAPSVHKTRSPSQETSALPTATVSPIGTPSGDESTTSTLEIPLNPEANALLLGADTSLTILSTVIATAENPTNISTTNLTALPVGMNLGFGSHWPGALIFGGNYDANRIWNESHWQTTPETSAGNGSFTQTGTLLLASGVQLRLYPTPNLTGNTTTYPFDTTSPPITTTTPLPATLNFTAETLTVPDASFCDRNFTVVFNPDSATYPLFEIPVWADLVPAGSRCVVGSRGGEIILGRPFFQAAYVYVTEVGDLYFSSIRRDGSVGVAPREFDLHAALGGGMGGGGGDVYANATAEEAGAKGTAVSGAGRVATIMSSSAWGVVLVVGVVVVGWAV